MQASTNLRNLRARMECGMSTSGDARVLFAFLDHLTWKADHSAKDMRVCRHCGVLRGGEHLETCPAALVA